MKTIITVEYDLNIFIKKSPFFPIRIFEIQQSILQCLQRLFQTRNLKYLLDHFTFVSVRVENS